MNLTPAEVIDLAYKAHSRSELIMANELLLQRLATVPASQHPEKMAEELGCLELVTHRMLELPPEDAVEGFDPTAELVVEPEEEEPLELPDSTEAGLRDRLGG
jgi:hypothetical protein